MSAQPGLSPEADVDIVSGASLTMMIIFVVLCGLAFLIGLPLNGYVLFVTGCRMQRTASTVLFLNRAVSDFIFLLCVPLRFIFIFWGLKHVNTLSSYFTSLHMFSSAFLLTAISVHHCILVAWPERAQKLHTASLVFWVALGTWALSVGFSLRYSDLWESLFPPASTRRHFGRDEANKQMKDIVIQFLVKFLIPLALNLIPMLYILVAARLTRNRMIQATPSLKILLPLLPTFFICWLPYHVVFFLQISDLYPTDSLITSSVFIYCLLYFNCCLNPIFYLTMDEDFLRYQQCAHDPHSTDHSGRQPAE